MSESKSEKPVVWKDFLRDVDGPKLVWAIMQMLRLGIDVDLSGVNINNKPILQIPNGYAELALAQLNTEIGMFELGTTNNVTMAWADLPEGHWFFTNAGESAENKELWEKASQIVEDFWNPAPEGSTAKAGAMGSSKLADPAAYTPPVIEDPVVEEAKAGTIVGDPPVEEDDDDDNWDDFDEPAPEPEDDDLKAGVAYLKADEVLTHEIVEFPHIKPDKAAHQIEMYYQPSSSNVECIGWAPKTDPNVGTIYIQYKKGERVYRYSPRPITVWHNLLDEGVRRESGIIEASVGSLAHHALRVPADAGEIRCQRLDGEHWAEVLPKAERTKETKDKAKG